MEFVQERVLAFIQQLLGWSENERSGGALGWLTQMRAGIVGDAGDFVFFKLVMDHLRDKINQFGFELMGRVMEIVGMLAVVLLTIWILIEGYRLVTGQMRESAVALVTKMARSVLIVFVAVTMGLFGNNLQTFLVGGTDGDQPSVKGAITEMVTGEKKTVEDQIDSSLGWMQVAMSSLDALDVVSDPSLVSERNRAEWMMGLGTGGPAVTAGAMLLLYEVAMALFIGLGPLFILCLLFEQTKQLFSRWLFYGIGTMFSMAVLAVMASISLEMVTRVAAAMWASSIAGQLFLGENVVGGFTNQAMQQGGMGLILTTLIITAPPMAAMFFQGTLGSFTPYAAIGAHLQTSQSSPPGPAGTNALQTPGKDGGRIADSQNPSTGFNTPTSTYGTPGSVSTAQADVAKTGSSMPGRDKT